MKKQPHILLVDDEKSLLSTLKNYLEIKGYRISTSLNGREALNKVLENDRNGNSIDLLITDIQMPVMNGTELIAEIKKNEIEIPTIVMSAFGDKNMVVKLMHEGVLSYIDKPFLKEELIEKIKTILATQRMIKEKSIFNNQMAQIGASTGTMVHDLNNLLAVILGNTDLLIGEFYEKDLDTTNQLKIIYEAGKQVNSIIGGIHTLLKGKLNTVQPLNISNILNNQKEILKVFAGKLNEFQMEIPDDLGILMTSKGDIERVLMNLVVNSRDAFSENGNIFIKASRENSSSTKEEFTDQIDHEYVKISVKDTGPGMDKETISKIFKPYFTKKEKGTGLGLSIVAVLVRDLGGSMEVKSEVGVGTEFVIKVPVMHQEDVLKNKIAI